VPVWLITQSTRPDLYRVRPAASASHVMAVNWHDLQSALEAPEPPQWLAGEIEIAGFAFFAEPANGSFRLVPSAGDWLRPPHFHQDETIEVHFSEAMPERPRHRTPVQVRGRILRGTLAARSGGILMKAADWRRWEPGAR
jgi:hypothetical protein